MFRVCPLLHCLLHSMQLNGFNELGFYDKYYLYLAQLVRTMTLPLDEVTWVADRRSCTMYFLCLYFLSNSYVIKLKNCTFGKSVKKVAANRSKT